MRAKGSTEHWWKPQRMRSVMLDLEGQITLASHRAAELYGSERVDEMPEESVEFLPQKTTRGLENFHRTLKEGCTRDIEYTFIETMEAHLAGEVSASAIGDLSGMPRACRGIVSDITERKRAEEALRQQHDELRAIYDGMFEGLLIMDFETKRFVRVNSSLCRMLGYTEEELLSMSVMDIHPEERFPGSCRDSKHESMRRYRDDVDVPVLRKDGSIFYARYHGQPARLPWTPMHRCLLPRYHRTQARPGAIAERTSHPQTPAAIQRPRTADSSPTKSMTAWPSSWPGRSCSSRPSIT